jgi:hypothetical protein
MNSVAPGQGEGNLLERPVDSEFFNLSKIVLKTVVCAN